MRAACSTALAALCWTASGGAELNNGNRYQGTTRSCAGTLELENLAFGSSGGLIASGGTTRLIDMEFIRGAPLIVQGGRVEAIGVSAEFVTATNGELALLFARVEDEPGFVFGGLSAFVGVTLGSDLTLTVHWSNNAHASLRTSPIDLNYARLNVTFPAGCPPPKRSSSRNTRSTD